MLSTIVNSKRVALTQASRVLKENQYKLEEQPQFSVEQNAEIAEVYSGVIDSIELQLQELLAMLRD
jgi:hypothetical protein